MKRLIVRLLFYLNCEMFYFVGTECNIKERNLALVVQSKLVTHMITVKNGRQTKQKTAGLSML